MPQTCWRQPPTQGQGALASSARAGGEDVDGRACRRLQDINHNGFVVIGLVLLGPQRQPLFSAVQHRLSEDHPVWLSRVGGGAGAVPVGYQKR